MNQNENRFIGWDDREAEEDRAALERWYRRQDGELKKQRRLWILIFFLVLLDVWVIAEIWKWGRL